MTQWMEHMGQGSYPRHEPVWAQRPSPGILCFRPDGRLLDISAELASLLDLPHTSSGGQLNLLAHYPLVQCGLARDLKKHMEVGNEAIFQGVYQIPGGLELNLRVHLMPIRDGAERIELFVGIVEDLKALGVAEKEASQAWGMDAIGRLSAGLARDFNDFTTSILGHTDLLLEQIPTGHPWRQQLLEIRHSAERAASLTRKLLALGQRQAITPRVMDLNELIEDMKGTIKALVGNSIEVVTSLEAELYPAFLDETQVEQVLLNLVMNAKEAMPSGGRLLIQTKNAFLDEAHGRIHGVKVIPGPYVMVAVTDTGIGMDQETRARVFEPFFTGRGKGAGLGLSVVYGIVKQSGGYVWIYSEPHLGATVKVYFPASGGKARARQTLSRERGGRGMALLVEDENDVRELTKAILARCGLEVLEASGAEEAMELAKSHPNIDLLVADMILPGMTGFELWERLASEYPRMKVILMSGYPDEVLKAHGSGYHGIPFLSKPFSLQELRNKLIEVLETSREPVFDIRAHRLQEDLMVGRQVVSRQPHLPNEESGKRRRILIVDDEASVRKLLGRLLEAEGYECVLASGAEEARERLLGMAFDLMLCDLAMPGISGLELAREVMPAFPEMAVVFVTGVDDTGVARDALELGAYGYILKPFKLNEILIQVANALRRRDLEIALKGHLQELERKVEERTQELQRTLTDLRQALEGAVMAISLAVESRDPYTAGHQRRVAELSRAIAKEMGLAPGRIEGLYMAGLIHDLGKIAVPAEILSKPTRLSKAEFELIKSHPQVGYEILKPIHFPWPVADMVRQHHEKINGSGYPLGLKGDEMLIEAKILAVADIVEAIASHRPYRPALGLENAMDEILANKGILYDPEVVDACVRLIKERGLNLDEIGPKES